jgi:cell wall-associated NlpC family hydrolase
MTNRKKFATFAVACSLLCGAAMAVEATSSAAATSRLRATAATADPVALTAAAALQALDTDTFALRLEDVAYAVDYRLEADAGLLDAAWARADHEHQVALLSALTQVGVPYRRNAIKVGIGFDCSGLTAFAWGQVGLALEHHSSTQLRNALPRTIDTAQAGDLVYYPGHVMMWLGIDNLIVHAPQRGHPVDVDTNSTRRMRREKFGDPLTAPVASPVNRSPGLS